GAGGRSRSRLTRPPPARPPPPPRPPPPGPPRTCCARWPASCWPWPASARTPLTPRAPAPAARARRLTTPTRGEKIAMRTKSDFDWADPDEPGAIFEMPDGRRVWVTFPGFFVLYDESMPDVRPMLRAWFVNAHVEFRPPKYVYLMGVHRDGSYKIGVSRQPHIRVSGVRAAEQDPGIELIHAFLCADARDA